MRLIIVDDDPIVSKSLKSIIEMSSRQGGSEMIEVLALGQSGEEAISLYQSYRPDILLLDIQMPGLNGLLAARRILELDATAKILFLTTFLDEAYVVEALRLGAKGYLMKSSVESILPALHAIAEGQRVFGDEIVEHIPIGESSEEQLQNEASRKAASQFADLSEAEWAILKLLAQGLNNQEIAQELHFSGGTVRNYISSLLDKSGLRDRTQAVVAFYKAGFSA